MTDTQRKRDPRYTRTVGEAPDLGRRFVENGKVKIEWQEDGKHRSRTVGDNSAEVRRKADEELERLMGLAEVEPDAEGADEVPGEPDDIAEELEAECCEFDVSWLIDEFRCRADALMDLADDLAEAFERGLVTALDAFKRSHDPDDDEESGCDPDDVLDAEIVDQCEERDEADKTE